MQGGVETYQNVRAEPVSGVLYIWHVPSGKRYYLE
jgi:hypothetical protein